MCCGFGGALLLFLLMASSSAPGGGDNDILVVRCSHRAGPKAQLGIEYQGPEDAEWRWPGPQAPGVRAFAAPTGPESGGQAFLVLLRPKAGKWQFRAFQADF